MQTILITGGCGFIGSALIRHIVGQGLYQTINVDSLTYSASPAALAKVQGNPGYVFEHETICNRAAIGAILARYRPSAVIHLAAETHVDRSIDGPAVFIETNIVGTFSLLEATLDYYRSLTANEKNTFRFYHISTDEVYGDLSDTGLFTEETPYQPSSPYSASKAAADHLVKAWYRTYGMPIVMSHCSNNYGPFQFPEKLVPLMIIRAMNGESLPVYGDGSNVRDWIYVEDHVAGILAVLGRGRIGQTYNLGGNAELRNIDMVETICKLLDTISPRGDGRSYREQIAFVPDRPGHDLRYAIDATKARNELGWMPKETIATGLRRTINFYLDNKAWWHPILTTRYAGQRMGTK